MISFKGGHSPKLVVLHAVYFYLRYSVSLRDLEEILAERGVAVDHATLNRWAIKYSSTGEASVSALVAKRIVNKQQMRRSRMGAHYLLKVRAAVINGDLSERQKYQPAHRDRNQE